ncbi:MAG: CDP-alcohol phosphatidyltransferase family protein [Phycisphaerales bacterium]|nr:CDP-alcohol phosphatidyltransferase family protein [Phycisphaerales bacterium]
MTPADQQPATAPLWRRELPNWLTSARVVMAAVFFAVLTLWRWDDSAAQAERTDWLLLLAAGLFIVAVLTDIADGFLARRWHVESAFGRIMDPFADKILIVGAFVFLAGPDFWWEFPGGAGGAVPARLSGHGIQISGVYPWMVVVILGRELLVTSIRGVLEGQGIKFGADWWGKGKMILQSVAIPTVLIATAVTAVLPAVREHEKYHWWENPWGRMTIDITVWGMMFFTVMSGVPYVVRCVHLLAQARAAKRDARVGGEA